MRIIAGEARGRRLVAPRGRQTRPPLERLRESLFSILGEAVEEAEVLDLFAGAGAFGLEALSRGAARATFVERGREALEALLRNVKELGFTARSLVLRGDALSSPPLGRPIQVAPSAGPRRGSRRLADGEAEESAGSRPPEGYRIIFVDPPFELLSTPEGAAAVSRRVEELMDQFLAPGGVLILRQPARGDCPVARPPADRRMFGESVVLFFEKNG
jgi:16S rRNA G966 N2-methylase RsmD